MGSNPSFQPHWDADNEPQRGTLVTPLPSPDPPRESPDDNPLSDLGEGDGDQEMLDTDKPPGIQDPADPGAAPSEEPDGAQPGGDQEEAGDGGEPQEPEEHLEPYQIVLQGFRTISQTLSAAYGAASAKIQILVQKSLAKTTAEDRTFVWGASGAICHWLDSVRPAMAAMGENTNEQAKLLEAAQQAGKDALDSILELIPKEQEPQLTPVFPKATRLLAPALAVARWYTNEALQNIHSQLADLAREHMSEEQAGTLFNTILQVTCSFRQEMDNMAMNQVFLPSQIVPNLWGSRRGLFEGLSLMGPPSCSASWPASLVEWVTVVPACQNVLGSSQTPTKANLLSSGAVKTTPDSGKKPHQSTKQAAGAFWGDKARRKEDAEAQKLEEKCRKKSTGPLLSLGDHEDSIATLLKRAPASWISQPPSDVSGSGSKRREKSGENLLLPIRRTMNPSPTGQTSRRLRIANETPPRTWSSWRMMTAPPPPGKSKGAGKKTHTQNPDEEAVNALSQRLKGEARLAQYNLELATLAEYQNLHIPNLKGPPNMDDHSAYLSSVWDVSWSYPAKGNLVTACQYYQDLKTSKNREAIEAGETSCGKKE